MNIRIFTIIILSVYSVTLNCQTGTDINKTSQQVKKQGYRVKYYPSGSKAYEGIFKDDHPVGEFKRYYEDESVKSILIYSENGDTADATIFHYNGFISSRGRYINQKKEGKWKFYSATEEGYLICEENYSGNKKEGESVKYYPDGTLAERVIYKNDLREGEWLRFHPNGKPLLRAYLKNDRRNGRYEVWYDDGIPEISGFYKENLREGTWFFYNNNGTIRYKIEYVAGHTDDNQMNIDATKLIDELEKNSVNVADPEITGEIR